MGTAKAKDGAVTPQTWRDEPWLAALLRLVEKDAWVGTEERLLDELKAPAVEGVYRSGDSPRTLDDLHTYIASARRVFGQLDLDVLDYRDVSGDSLRYWREEVTYLPGASGWGLEEPMLVCQHSRIPQGEYYWALGRILKHWDPFALSLLLFTESDDNFGPAGRWIGPSFVLVNILRRHYPTFDNVPSDIVDLASPPGVRGCLPDYENIREYGRLFEPLSRQGNGNRSPKNGSSYQKGFCVMAVFQPLLISANRTGSVSQN
jgi:hypothetical protein